MNINRIRGKEKKAQQLSRLPPVPPFRRKCALWG